MSAHLCHDSGKVIYTKREALAILNFIKRSRGVKHRKEKRIYHCPNCNMWHLTSRMNLGPKNILSIMAFDGINKFIDMQFLKYEKTNDSRHLETLTDFFETVLQAKKFKAQRQYCLETIHRMNKHFFAGYFKREKP